MNDRPAAPNGSLPPREERGQSIVLGGRPADVVTVFTHIALTCPTLGSFRLSRMLPS